MGKGGIYMKKLSFKIMVLLATVSFALSASIVVSSVVALNNLKNSSSKLHVEALD